MQMLFLQKIFKEDAENSNKIKAQSVFYLCIILLACLKQLYGVQHHLDIPFFDESMYIKKGIQMHTQIYNDWGPSYNLWYFILSKFTNDATQTFYLNYILLTTLIPLFLFILLIRFGIRNNIALILTLSFLLQPILVNSFTYVSHFCIMVILLCFIFITYAKNNQSKVLTAIIASYICMYARQEFLLITITLIVLYAVLVIYEKKINFNLSCLSLIFITTGLYLSFGFISFKAAGIDRSYFAFIQHFYVNYVLWNKKLLTVEAFNKLDVFHGSKTMFQCLINNPLIFIKHMLTNLLNYFLQIYKYIENFILPQPIFHYLGKGKHILFLILFIYFLFFKRKIYLNISAFIQQYSFSSLLILIFFVWSFFSIIFIFPEKHYIIMHFGWLILIFGVLISKEFNFLNNRLIFYALITILMIFTPTSSTVGYFHNMVADARNQPNLKTVNYLKKNNPGTEQNIFTTEKSFEAYLPSNYKDHFVEIDSIAPYNNNGVIDIQRYLSDKNISIIFMNEKMQFLIKETLGITGNILLNKPEEFGFKKQIIDKKLNAYLLIKESK